MVGVPRHPTSCSVATTNVADRVANAAQAAIAELEDGAGMAECGAVIPPAAGVISGTDPRTGRRFVNQVFLGFTGGAAAPAADAWLTIGHVGNAGLVFQDSIEIDEIHHPIYVHARMLLPDTEGAGRTRGAPSALSEFGPLDCRLEIGYVSDGAINAARGTRGGHDGAPANQYRRTADGGQAPLSNCAMVALEPGGACFVRADVIDLQFSRLRNAQDDWLDIECAGQRLYRWTDPVPAGIELRDCAIAEEPVEPANTWRYRLRCSDRGARTGGRPLLELDTPARTISLRRDGPSPLRVELDVVILQVGPRVLLGVVAVDAKFHGGKLPVDTGRRGRPDFEWLYVVCIVQ